MGNFWESARAKLFQLLGIFFDQKNESQSYVCFLIFWGNSLYLYFMKNCICKFQISEKFLKVSSIYGQEKMFSYFKICDGSIVFDGSCERTSLWQKQESYDNVEYRFSEKWVIVPNSYWFPKRWKIPDHSARWEVTSAK